MHHENYVLMTAARNERPRIGKVIRSVCSQSHKPVRWVIVSDGSTDGTDELIASWAACEPMIHYLRMAPECRQRGFAAKVAALEWASAVLEREHYGFIGNLDADVSFRVDYFEQLIERFRHQPRLGLAGGNLLEKKGRHYRDRDCNRDDYVPGAVQMFRRSCFEEIGGYVRSRYGGEDTVAMLMARMAGWDIRAYADLPVYHLESSREKRGHMRDLFREGAMRQALGSHPLYELVKCVRTSARPPYVIGALARGCGFLWPVVSGQSHVVGREFIRFYRQQQMEHLHALVAIDRSIRHEHKKHAS